MTESHLNSGAPMRALRHRAIACLVLLAAAVALSACGSAKHPLDATADNNGFYVKLGDINYQLQVSRELNQYSTEDHQYLAGLPAGSSPAPNQLWYGVFLYAVNKSNSTATTTDTFQIVDTQDQVYKPTTLPAANGWAWTAQTLQPLQTEPGPESTASDGPTQGGLVLFKLPTSVYNNRPLTLEIFAQGQLKPATISLDL